MAASVLVLLLSTGPWTELLQTPLVAYDECQTKYKQLQQSKILFNLNKYN